MRLIVIRHGETESNLRRTLQGHRQGKLTPGGIRQARALAERFRDIELDAVYSSDLARTVDTVSEIIRDRDVPVNYLPELRERHYGIFEGRPSVEYEAWRDGSDAILPWWALRPQGGESLEDVWKRAGTVVDVLPMRHRDQTVLLAGHGSLNKVIFRHLLGLPWDAYRCIAQANTCVNELVIDGSRGARSLVMNCTAHLSDGALLESSSLPRSPCDPAAG